MLPYLEILFFHPIRTHCRLLVLSSRISKIRKLHMHSVLLPQPLKIIPFDWKCFFCSHPHSPTWTKRKFSPYLFSTFLIALKSWTRVEAPSRGIVLLCEWHELLLFWSHGGFAEVVRERNCNLRFFSISCIKFLLDKDLEKKIIFQMRKKTVYGRS